MPGSAARTPSGVLTPTEVMLAVCEVLNVSVEDVQGVQRHPRMVVARMLVETLTERLCISSSPEVAMVLCRGSHASVIESRAKLRRDPEEMGRRVDACVARIVGDEIAYQTASGEITRAMRVPRQE